MDIWSLTDLATPWAVHVVATLRIADRIAKGVTEIDDLAKASGAHAESLHRVLRHLVAKGVFEETAPGRFALNGAARELVGAGDRFFDLDGFAGRMAGAWASLLTAVRTGRPAYHTVFGRSYWDDLEAHPDIDASFDALMGPAGHGTPDPDVLLAGDWDGVRTVVDVGGGTGSLLASILRAHPDVRGVLVDRPNTIARSRELLASEGVIDRVTLVAQSFFDPLPVGGDVYLLKNVLADWADAEATAILTRCADAARPGGGRVIALSGVSPDEDGPPNPELLMLVLVGGKQRTLSEFRTIARAAGLEVKAAARQKSGRFHVECRAI
jgi:hypothetical protein